jgi:ATP-dependent Lon protease
MTDSSRTKYDYPLLPLKNVVVLPRSLTTLMVGRNRSIQALEEALARDHRLVVATQRRPDSTDPSPDELYRIGTLVEVVQSQRQADGNMQIVVEGLRRVKIENFIHTNRHFMVRIADLTEKSTFGAGVEALTRHVLDLFTQYAQLSQRVPADALETVATVRDPGYLADLLTAHVVQDVAERQALLETLDQFERLERVGVFLAREVEVLELEQKIRNKVRSQIDRNQREFYLREQLKAIHDELGGEAGNEIAELRQKVESKGLPEEVAGKMLKEVSRLERMSATSPESAVIRNYIDWVLALPWTEETEDRLDIDAAEQILNEDHYGLEKVKERIIEFLAVRQLTTGSGARMKSPILCLIGPPGVGKTSLGQSVARAMGRKFVRISLGGVRDEAEIRGHRRTYVGALPGRIIQAMKTAGTRNPLIMLDEIDKMSSDYRGDPSSALLEVLDPEQNFSFTDHYIEIPYDLSDVMFITTGNVLYNVPRPLQDRMEIIEIGGYTEEEKIQIARRHLLAKQVAAHGLKLHYIEISDRVLSQIIRYYTREAGVRNLERRLAAICRKAARRFVQGRTTRVRVTPHTLEEYLGPRRFIQEAPLGAGQVGVAIGLAWTEHGGELLPVEVATMPGKGGLTITGRLGDVMQESAKAALSYARSRSELLHIDPDFQEKYDLHIHLPEGAIPKDGPSAGITIASALISALTKKPLRGDVAMTGEITLRGRVLAIGGLKEKVMAAHRAGMRRIIAPAENERDVADIPRNVRRDLEFVWVEEMDQVINEAFSLPEPIIEEKEISAENVNLETHLEDTYLGT